MPQDNIEACKLIFLAERITQVTGVAVLEEDEEFYSIKNTLAEVLSESEVRIAQQRADEEFAELTSQEGQAQDAQQERSAIPSAVRREVWRRDGGKCTRCGSRENLEYDHIIPVAKGGSNTARNIELLCEACNRLKSDSIG